MIQEFQENEIKLRVAVHGKAVKRRIIIWK